MLAWSLPRRMMLMFCWVVGVVLAASFAGFYVLLSREVYNQLDEQLPKAPSPVVADVITDSPSEKEVDELNLQGQYYALFDRSGNVSHHSRNLRAQTLHMDSGELGSHKPVFRTVETQAMAGSVAIPFQQAGKPLLLAVVVSISQANHILATFRRIILLILPLSLSLTAGISAWHVGKSLTPIATFTRHTENLAGQVSGFYQQDSWQPLPIKTPR